MTIVVAPKARDDLREAYEYIQEDNPGAADRVLAHIIEVIGMLASGVMQGREVVLRDGKKFIPGRFLLTVSTIEFESRIFR